MKSVEVQISNPTGLHARPAKLFVQKAKEFNSKISVQYGEKEINAKSLISLLTLGVEQGGTIKIMAEGEDETTAIEALNETVKLGLGE